MSVREAGDVLRLLFLPQAVHNVARVANGNDVVLVDSSVAVGRKGRKGYWVNIFNIIQNVRGMIQVNYNIN